MLSSESSAEPGRWNTARAPFQRGIMDAITDQTIETVAIMSSAQVGKTEIALNALGYYIDQDPSPMLLLQPTLGLAEAFSKDRLAPMLRDTPALRGKVGQARSRDGENTLLHKKFAGGHVTLAGANSPSSLASRPIRILIGDEIDRYPWSAGKEGDPVKLATKRTTTFWNRRRILLSTPTIEGASRIEDEWKNSDQRHYLVPCPDCGHKQHFRWEQIKYKLAPDGRTCDPATVRYECESCRGLIAHNKKLAMLHAGEWVAKFPGRKTAGFHLNELYSPWKAWHEVVDDYVEAKEATEKLMVWWNTSLGLPFAVKGGDAPDWQKLYDRREKYPIGTAPRRVCLLTCGVDVQIDRVEFKIVGWNRGESWAIYHGVVFGDTSTLVPFQEAEAEIFREWPHESGEMMTVRMMAVDSGFNTSTVYKWVRTLNSTRAMAVKGMQHLDIPIAMPKLIDVNVEKKKKIKRGGRVWGVGVNVLKPDLYARLKKAMPTADEIEAKGYPQNFVHFPEFPVEYFRQITAEELVTERGKTGHGKRIWFKRYPANEALDMMIYSMAAYHAVGAHRWKEDRWAKLEAQFGVAPGKPDVLKAPPATVAPAPQVKAEQPKKKVQPAVDPAYRGFWGKR